MLYDLLQAEDDATALIAAAKRHAWIQRNTVVRTRALYGRISVFAYGMWPCSRVVLSPYGK